MKPSLSLSTCWNSSRHQDGYAMLREIADLGFTHAELSHGTRITLVPGILKAVEEGVIQVSSIHNFCPLPTGVMQAAPNLFEPSAQDGREREQWYRHTRRSLDFAGQVQAGVLVLHLGSIHCFWFSPIRAFARWIERRGTVDLDRAADRAALTTYARRLRKRLDPYWRQVQDSLERIRDYACERGVQLGCENREQFGELPLDDDFGPLFAGLTSPHLAGYWHDTGHAAIKERWGLLQHREHLARNADHLIGFHLHDVNAEGEDHQAVGSGTIDFRMVSEFWRPQHRFVIELSPRVSVDGVRRSKAYVEALLEERFGRVGA